MSKRDPIDNNRYCAGYREKHREAFRLYQREWRRKNPEVVKAYRKDAALARAAKKIAVTGEPNFRCSVYPATCPKQVKRGFCSNITRECEHQRSVYCRRGR